MTAIESFNEFNNKFGKINEITSDWYKNTLGVTTKKTINAKSFNTKGEPSEEYIRARFIYMLIATNKYKPENICVEATLPKGNGAKSIDSDIIIFKDNSWIKKDFGSAEIRQNILVIMEAKRDSKKEDIENVINKQLRTAMNEYEGNPENEINFVFGVYFDEQQDIIIFKKENNHPIKRYNNDKIKEDDNYNLGNRDFIEDLPSFKDLIENIERFKDKSKLLISDLEPIDQDTFVDLLEPLNRAKDRIGVSLDIHSLIVEFLTYKVYDEKKAKKNNSYLRFYIEKKEETEASEIQTLRRRILSLQKEAQSDYETILSSPIFTYIEKNGRLQPNHEDGEDFLKELIKIIEFKSILNASNESFNQIIFNNFGSSVDKALEKQFFTPIPAARMIVQMLKPDKTETVIDPCSGICDFLAVSFRIMHDKSMYLGEIGEAKNLYGFDKDKKVLKLAELNLVLNGDGGANIHHMNSLTQKLSTKGAIVAEGDFNFNEYDLIDWSPIGNKPELKKFKIVVTNPPFGKGRDLKLGKDSKWDIPKSVAKLYETYWLKLIKDTKDKTTGEITISSGQKIYNGNINYENENDFIFPKSMDMGVLFLENAVKILEEGGRMAIVLSNSISSIKEWLNIRAWFMSKMRLVGAVDLPAGTFGETSVATTVLFAYKPRNKEILKSNYNIFSKEIQNIGYEVKTKDRIVTFQPTFLIDEQTFDIEEDIEGNKILLEDFTTTAKDFSEWIKFQETELREAFNS
ncbi:HsdM family class I SAM-dependent methyltransferase [Aliarcobacter cryaerophilus]|uniref:N-6 DNA methylase n=2 Tax=unclassified Arcobacter TaxID=2593671 RepID=A0AA96D1M6_9BACT|nr:N-6 DNA methylase [Arcobacter sp. AZ-2023]WPD09057.1 N-6 DNA methylase [Arcobacter sp. DSM 115954]WNL13889.1 N-6 DNA methylase [Arcobacter sp. AZ-2023]WNL18105.1 N-6 DNA methylase [Arcobacter sp. AZ-2023]WNL20240.1 N-6 DNA methylase [Arcobacter sp. AZ-2023]